MVFVPGLKKYSVYARSIMLSSSCKHYFSLVCFVGKTKAVEILDGNIFDFWCH